MNLQLELFPELQNSGAEIITKLKNFVDDKDEANAFASSIKARLLDCSTGGLLLACCSHAVEQQALSAAFLARIDGLNADHVIELEAPPRIGSAQDQIHILLERVRVAVDARDLRYKHSPFSLAPGTWIKTTEQEAAVDLLRSRKIRLICVRRGEQLVDEEIRGAGRLMSFLEDLGRRAGAMVVLFGSRLPLLRAKSSSALLRGVSAVVQRLYDIEEKDDQVAFIRLLKRFEAIVAPIAGELKLSASYKELMIGAGGDAARLARWLIHACGEATFRKEALSPEILRETAPDSTERRLAQLESEQWRRFRADTSSKAAASASANSVATPSPRKPKLKPGERKPGRDSYPDAA